MIHRRLSIRLGSLMLFAVVAVSTVAPAGAQMGQEPYQPPVVRFDPGGISLVEAVRIALENDPNILLQQASTTFQQGFLQEQTGAFDSTIVASASYEYREQELRDSRKEIERQKREDGRELLERAEAFRDDAEATLAALQQAQDGATGLEFPGHPELEAQILLIDALIAQNLDDPEAVARLRELRQDFINEQIDQTAQSLADALAEIEEQARILEQLGEVPKDEVFYNAQVRTELQRLLRSGIFLNPFFTGSWQGENFKGKRREEDFGGKGIEDVFTFEVGLGGKLPLGRGRGAESTAALENSARIDYQASQYALEHRAAVTVLQTVQAYWSLRSAQEAVDVAQRSVGLQEILVQATNALIEIGELPDVDRARVQASEARARARLEDSQRDLHRARVNLAAVMGIAVTSEEETLPLASDEFPTLPPSLPSEATLQELAQQATVELRRDLRAARSLQESGQVLTRAAQVDQRPRVDLDGRIWATALKEAEVPNRFVGPSGSLSLTFERPLGNNLFAGRYVQREAELRQRQIDAADLERQIDLAIIREADSLQDAAESVRQAEASVDFYQRTIDAAIEAYQQNNLNLVDTILTEDQQTGALLELVFARSQFARILAQLRFEAGRLIRYDADASAITRADLTTVPGAGQ